jgi:hypothetical protein
MKTFVDKVPKEYQVSRLKLDPSNPRLRLYPGGDKDKDLIERLCRLSGSQSPSQIVKYILADRGFLHNCIPTVFVEPGARNPIVIDGNRRMAALKMILDLSLVPNTRHGLKSDCEKLRALVPDKIRCWVARSKSDAARIKYRAHNEGTKEWETLAKYSTHYDAYKEGQSIGDIVELTGSDTRRIVSEINTWKLVECLIEMIPDFEVQSEGITSFERVTTSYSEFAKRLGIQVNSEGVFEIPPSREFAEVLHTIYLKSAKSSGFSRVVDNNDASRAKFLDTIIPVGFLVGNSGLNSQIGGADTGAVTAQLASGSAQSPELAPVGGVPSNPNLPAGGGAAQSAPPGSGVHGNSSSQPSPLAGNPPLPSLRQILSPTRNVGKKAAAIYDEYAKIDAQGDFPIATAALTRALIETTLKWHAKRLKCYSEDPQRQQEGRSDALSDIAAKLKKHVTQAGLVYSSDLVSSISSACKAVTELNDVMHKDGSFRAGKAVTSSLNSLAHAVENLIKMT